MAGLKKRLVSWATSCGCLSLLFGSMVSPVRADEPSRLISSRYSSLGRYHTVPGLPSDRRAGYRVDRPSYSVPGLPSSADVRRQRGYRPSYGRSFDYGVPSPRRRFVPGINYGVRSPQREFLPGINYGVRSPYPTYGIDFR